MSEVNLILCINVWDMLWLKQENDKNITKLRQQYEREVSDFMSEINLVYVWVYEF